MSKIDGEHAAKAKAELASRLREYVGRVPARCGDWGFMRTSHFKEAHAVAVKVLAAKNQNTDKLREALSRLSYFFEETML